MGYRFNSDADLQVSGMIEATDQAPAFELKTFQALGSFEVPALPTVHAALAAYDYVKEKLQQVGHNSSVADDELRRSNEEWLIDTSEPPVCRPLLAEFEKSLEAWLADRDRTNPIRLVILPPGCRINLVEHWAAIHEHEVLTAPSRDALLSADDIADIDVRGEEVLVIPRLSAWFLRHYRGLRHLEVLLNTLGRTRRPCVVCCNSWAWSYISLVLDANHVLPQALTYQPFDSVRLQCWLTELAFEHGLAFRDIKDTEDGDRVFATNECAEPSGSFMNRLAARSRGIPWVAWQLWQRSLMVSDKQQTTLKDGAGVSAGENAERQDPQRWVCLPGRTALPDIDQHRACLVFHALLLHDDLTMQEIESVISGVGIRPIVQSLVNFGFLSDSEQRLSCTSARYPDIRQNLADAGFPVDRL